MSELRAEFTALKTTAGDRDPVRLRYIESLLHRAETSQGRLAEILQEKTSKAMADYRQAAASVQRHGRHKPGGGPLRELNRLLETLRQEQDDPHIPPLEEAMRQQELELVDAIAAQTNHSSHGMHARQEELKAARRFHAAMVRLNADKVVNRALEEVPESAGPLNPQRLATRSLTAMRDLSPHYLSRFVSYIDTLFWLEQSSKPGKR